MTSVKLRDTHRRNLSCLRARSKKCWPTEPPRSTEGNASARARFVVGRLLQGAHLKASCVSASASETLCWLSLFFGSSACNASPTTSNKKRSQAKLQMSTARSTYSETFSWSLDGLIPNLSLFSSQTVSSPSLFYWKMLSSHFLIKWAHSVKEEDKAGAPSICGFSDRTVTFI